MTLEEIKSYCEFTDCTVSFGSSEAGFVTLDGGVHTKYNNYRRFLAHNELSGLPSPAKVLESATIFKIRRGEKTEEISREEFEKRLKKFQTQVA